MKKIFLLLILFVATLGSVSAVDLSECDRYLKGYNSVNDSNKAAAIAGQGGGQSISGYINNIGTINSSIANSRIDYKAYTQCVESVIARESSNLNSNTNVAEQERIQYEEAKKEQEKWKNVCEPALEKIDNQLTKVQKLIDENGDYAIIKNELLKYRDLEFPCTLQGFQDSRMLNYYIYSGMNYFNNLEFDKAIGNFEGAYSIKPVDALMTNIGYAYMYKGSDLLENNRDKESVDSFRKALEYKDYINEKDYGLTLGMLGEILFGLGRYTEGLEYYNEADKIGTLDAYQLHDLCKFYMNNGKDDIALDYCNRGYTIAEDNSNTKAFIKVSIDTLTGEITKYEEMLNQENIETNNNTLSPDEICYNNFGTYSEWTGEYADNGNVYCDCTIGYEWNDDGSECIPWSIKVDINNLDDIDSISDDTSELMNELLGDNTEHSFKDYSSQYYTDTLSNLGIIVYKENIEEYNLDYNVLRQEIAAVTRGLAGIEKKNTCDNTFKDVSSTTPNTWACSSIEALYDNGLIAINDKFRPEDNISKAEAVGMIIKAIYGDSYSYQSNLPGTWQEQVVNFAVQEGISNSFTDYDNYATRGFIFNIAVNALEVK